METSQNLAAQMAEKGDEELLAMLAKQDDWSPLAIDAARAELDKRNVDVTQSIRPAIHTTTNYVFRDLSGLTKFLKVLLILGAIVGAIAVLSGLMQVALLGHSYTQAEGSSNDTREEAVALVQVALYLFTVVIFGRWIFRANRNVRALGANDLTETPGWAVGYFFVPIVCLWKPYQAMKELWRASQNPSAWRNMPASQILPGWWTLWIVSNLLTRASASEMGKAHTVFELQAATYAQILSDTVDVGLCAIALILVSQIYSAQTKAVAQSV
ncbi:MAG TPA: DUF4328 domain-containing protein [Methylomirabilota bacterium]|nr:DUF4328 domain-containing protein [Methylomirabilota bacterium]